MSNFWGSLHGGRAARFSCYIGNRVKCRAASTEQLGFAKSSDVEDAVLLRVPKAYPAYFGTYARIKEIQEFIDTIPNLWPVGRNGMHRYNNMDHSMLTAMEAVDCLLLGGKGKERIWNVNTEQEYHEERQDHK